MTEQAISPLRRRMIEDMTIRKFAQKTQHDYVQRVKEFASYLPNPPTTSRVSASCSQFHSSQSTPSRSPPRSPKSRKPQSIPAHAAAAACASSRSSLLGNSQSTARPHFRRRSGSTPHDDNLKAIAPQSRSPVCSLLSWPSARYLAAFRAGLGDLGYVEGRNVGISYPWLTPNNYDLLPSIIADQSRVAVIASPGGGSQIARAAKAATTSMGRTKYMRRRSSTKVKNG
jgi:hypothetical protein